MPPRHPLLDFINEFGFVLPKTAKKQPKDVPITDYNAESARAAQVRRTRERLKFQSRHPLSMAPTSWDTTRTLRALSTFKTLKTDPGTSVTGSLIDPLAG
jgi:hypothetical protein